MSECNICNGTGKLVMVQGITNCSHPPTDSTPEQGESDFKGLVIENDLLEQKLKHQKETIAQAVELLERKVEKLWYENEVCDYQYEPEDIKSILDLLTKLIKE